MPGDRAGGRGQDEEPAAAPTATVGGGRQSRTGAPATARTRFSLAHLRASASSSAVEMKAGSVFMRATAVGMSVTRRFTRSEERRVGKEWVSRWRYRRWP